MLGECCALEEDVVIHSCSFDPGLVQVPLEGAIILVRAKTSEPSRHIPDGSIIRLYNALTVTYLFLLACA